MKKYYSLFLIALVALATNTYAGGVGSTCVSDVTINASANPLILCHPTTETLTLTMTGTTYDSVQWVRTDLTPEVRLAGGPAATTLYTNRWTTGNIVARVWCDNSYAESAVQYMNRFDMSFAAGQDEKLCFGEAVTLSVPAVAGLSYEWKVNDINGPVAGTGNSFTTANTGNIWCKMIQPVGYTGCFKYTKMRLIIPKSCDPVVLQTPENPYLLCNEQYGYLTPTIPGGGSVDSVQWFRNGEYVTGLNGNDTIYFNRWSIGDYYGIGWFMGTQSNITNTVPVNQFDIRIKTGDGYLCGPETVTLVAPSLHAPTNYEWFDGDLNGVAELSGPTDSIYTTGYIGNVWCKLTHDGGCYKYTKFRVFSDLACVAPLVGGGNNNYKMDYTTESALESFETSIYPNPNKGTFKLTVSGLQADYPLTIEMYEVSGRKISEVKYMASDNVEQFEMNNGSLASGIYAVRVSHLNQTVTNRVIVE